MLLQLNDLHVVRGSLPVLSGINLDLPQGESIALKGASGCGKSTLLKTIVGGCTWQARSFNFKRKPVTATNIQFIRQQSGYIGQESTLAGLSVRDSLMQPFEFSAYRRRKFPEHEMLRLLATFYLPVEILDRHPSGLSGGQRQRLSIIRVLLLEPELIIADEPTSALDSDSRKQVVDELLNRGRSVISTSHDQHWLDSCDRIIHMSQGRILEEVEYDRTH